MILVQTILPAARADEAAPTPAHTLALPLENRRKGRQRAQLSDGRELALLLPPGTVLRHGDRLRATDGTVIAVEAAPEPVLQVTADDATALTRAAYHLGNRHIPVQVGPGFLRLAPDAVLEGMLTGLGVSVERREEPFEPEEGAYGGGHRHGHDETFAEDHALAQRLFDEHDRPHEHAPGAAPHRS